MTTLDKQPPKEDSMDDTTQDRPVSNRDNVISLAKYRPKFHPPIFDDTRTNQLWDHLLALAQEGYKWRDFDQLDELMDVIAELRPLIEVPYDMQEFEREMERVKQVCERATSGESRAEWRKRSRIMKKRIQKEIGPEN